MKCFHDRFCFVMNAQNLICVCTGGNLEWIKNLKNRHTVKLDHMKLNLLHDYDEETQFYLCIGITVDQRRQNFEIEIDDIMDKKVNVKNNSRVIRNLPNQQNPFVSTSLANRLRRLQSSDW